MTRSRKHLCPACGLGMNPGKEKCQACTRKSLREARPLCAKCGRKQTYRGRLRCWDCEPVVHNGRCQAEDSRRRPCRVPAQVGKPWCKAHEPVFECGASGLEMHAQQRRWVEVG